LNAATLLVTAPLLLQTPLLIAPKNNAVGVVEVLLAAGAAVDAADDRNHPPCTLPRGRALAAPCSACWWQAQ
jgi:hypothetical protein